MASHHFIGNGLVSAALTAAVAEPDELIETVAGQVRSAGLEVVGHRSVSFDGGGLTLVWVLAESHLVLHHWAAEGFATVDLHVCDYHASNAVKAKRLVAALTTYCFAPATERWQEVHLDDPVTTDAAVAALA